jgi:hypothetical protein
MKSSILALLVGLSAITFAQQTAAQDTAQRDAAISRCVREAHTQYPTDDADGGRGRTSVYKACMTRAGFTP